MNIFCLVFKDVDSIILIVDLDPHDHVVHVCLGSEFLV